MASIALAKEQRSPRLDRQRTRPIITYLIALALVALVPAIIFTAVLLQRNSEAQRQIFETLVTGTTRSIVQAVEREVTAKITTLKVLAASPQLLEGDYRGFHASTRTALQDSGAYLFVMNSALDSFLSTRTDFDEPPIKTADPESALKALATKDVVVSNGLFGRVSQKWVFNILWPIARPGQETIILALNQNAENLSFALLNNKLPEGWNVALVDGRGVIVATTPGGALSGETFTLLGRSGNDLPPGWTTIRGTEGDEEDLQAIVQKSPLTGWSLIAWAPSSVIAKPLADSILFLIIGGIVLAALVIIAVYWMSLQISRSVRGLARDAKRLGAGEAVPARAYPISEIATISQALSDAARQRQAAESEVRFLMRELAHRSKNQMTVIAAMAKQTAGSASSLEQFMPDFERRIHGLARSTDLLLANGMAGVDFSELLTSQIAAFGPVGTERVEISGPSLRLNTQAAQIVGMAAHELATNAVKYGAFADETGRLRVSWAIKGDQLDFVWRETVRVLTAPASERRGFGTTVLNSMVGRGLGANVARVLHEDGIEWSFDIPLSALDPDSAPDQAASGEDART
jgi:two-component sensor histidine kinase